MPNIICITPKMTDIFILKELMKEILLDANDQTGSRPKGYGPVPLRKSSAGSSWKRAVSAGSWPSKLENKDCAVSDRRWRKRILINWSIDLPPTSEYVEWFAKDVVVDDAGIDTKQTHHENDVPTTKDGSKYLQTSPIREIDRGSYGQESIINIIFGNFDEARDFVLMVGHGAPVGMPSKVIILKLAGVKSKSKHQTNHLIWFVTVEYDLVKTWLSTQTEPHTDLSPKPAEKEKADYTVWLDSVIVRLDLKAASDNLTPNNISAQELVLAEK